MMTKESLLQQITAVGLIVDDLRLFLDVNPGHPAALTDFKQMCATKKQLLETYENQFGPLLGRHDKTGAWVNGPWPWQHETGGGR